jgi:hypothetical protein
MEYLWPRYSVRITIERAGDEPIFSAIPYLARQLSVRNIVPTLTSNERCDLPLDGPVLATNDTGFILVSAGAVRPAAVCSGHGIALHRDACRGGLQVWRERSSGLQVPEVLIEASANIVVKAESAWVITVRRPHCGRGTAPPFIGQGGSSLHVCRSISYVWRRGEQCHGANGRPGDSYSSRGVVARPVLVQKQLRGWWRSGWLFGRRPWAGSRVPSTGGPYAAQWRSWRRPVPVHSNSIGDVVTVPGVALQWRGWPHRADSDGEDHSRRPDVTA